MNSWPPQLSFYEGRGEVRSDPPPPPIHGSDLRDPAGYIADPGMVDAVNVAMLLGQPLLVTGEAGTGKTQLAHSVSWELGLGDPLVFEAKSGSSARDLFYSFDTLGRFQAAQSGDRDVPASRFFTLNALGEAIARSNPPPLQTSLGADRAQFESPRRSVVLIDEIDKAPRDFPNDILNELERMFFRVPELGGVVFSAAPELLPIVIMTSNSEKNLPDAFLRRCIFYNIPFPDLERLEQIVLVRLRQFGLDHGPMVRGAIEFVLHLRQDQAGLHKRPGTAELLNWVTALSRLGVRPDVGLREQSELAARTVSTLAKMAIDQDRAAALFADWLGRRPP